MIDTKPDESGKRRCPRCARWMVTEAAVGVPAVCWTCTLDEHKRLERLRRERADQKVAQR
jgi:hypothetical protein